MSYLLHNGAVVFAAFAIIMVLGAWSIGRALAATWRRYWLAIPYTILFALAGRVVFWGLSGGDNFDFFAAFGAVYLDVVVLVGVAGIAFRLTLTRKMLTQYPWLYVQSSPFGWREQNAPKT
ncbi:MAG: hypothetical protein KIT16_11550 [Rhodospirillaceae bacterium]|nr:hypothetical protein [Rhodospirillaceae bacterium]